MFGQNIVFVDNALELSAVPRVLPGRPLVREHRRQHTQRWTRGYWIQLGMSETMVGTSMKILSIS